MFWDKSFSHIAQHVIIVVSLWEIIVNIPVLEQVLNMKLMSLGFTDAALYWLFSSLSNEHISSGGGMTTLFPITMLN